MIANDEATLMTLPPLVIRLAAPRGFCAGVSRAIEIVENCLEMHGSPVYVRHEIVHNHHVVRDLESKGAIFVEELDEIPDGYPVVFSAHGVPKSVPAEAARRDLVYFDATCPLVSKIHRSAERHRKAGRQIILIGHAGHPEVIGTLGQLPPGEIALVETVEDVADLAFDPDAPLAYVTQTTLSIDDTVNIVDALKERYPGITGMADKDICYATTNRQNAVKAIAPGCDGMIVVGGTNSSNSQRLVEVAQVNGCPDSLLLPEVADLDWDWLADKTTIGVTAGASTPDILIDDLIDACSERRTVTREEVVIAREDAQFKLPANMRR